MPQVKNIIEILDKAHNISESNSLDNFKNEQAWFIKKHSEAKDFVKFLTTLEWQFKNIQMGDL